MKSLRILRKRGLALILVLTMCLSLLQVTAYAEEAGAEIDPIPAGEVSEEAAGEDVTNPSGEEATDQVPADSEEETAGETEQQPGGTPAEEPSEESEGPADSTNESQSEETKADEELLTTSEGTDTEPVVCTCESKCTASSVNGDCPVCGAEGANLDSCDGTAPETSGLNAEIEWTDQDKAEFTLTFTGEGVIDGDTVLSNGRELKWYFMDGLRLTSVKVDGAIEIAYQLSSPYLKEVELSGGVVVGENAFVGSTALEKLTVDGATIGDNAFGHTHVTNGWNGLDEYWYCDSLTEVTLKNVTSIGRYAFEGCRNLESATLENVGSIGSYVFYNSTKLAELTLDNADGAAIDANAFYIEAGEDEDWNRLSPIKKLTLKNMETTGNAYKVLYGLESLVLENVGTVSDSAFIPAPLSKQILKTVTMTNVQKIGEGIQDSKDKGPFQGSTVETVIINGATNISKNAFRGCKSLTSVTMNGGAIETYAFYDCANLEKINGLSTVTSIGARALENCAKLDLTTEPISGSTQLGYSSIFQGVEYLEARMESIMNGSFGLNLVPEAEELTVPDGWTDSKIGTENDTEADKTQITKAAKWANEDRTVADVELQFSHSQKPGMDFLFVLDLSNSMTNIGGSTDNNSRFYDMQSKMLDVATELVTNKDYNNQVAFVTFGGYVGKNNPCHIASIDFTNDPEVVASFSDGMAAQEQNTDYVAAFTKAQEVVNAHDSSRDLAVIFISDGRPTYEGTTKLSKSDQLYSTIDKTANIAKEFESKGVKVFGVLQSVPDGELKWAEYAMNAICTEKLYFKASDTREFSDAVNAAIGAAYGTYTITDVVDKDFDLDQTSIVVRADGKVIDLTAENAPTKIAVTGDTITWTIYGLPFTTYTLSFKENLKQVNGEYPCGSFDTNSGDATVKNNVGEEVNKVETPVLSRYAYRIEHVYTTNSTDPVTVPGAAGLTDSEVTEDSDLYVNAAEQLEHDGILYGFTGKSLAREENGTYVITLRYDRTVAIPAVYTVIHEYYTDGELDNRVIGEPVTGAVGDVILASTIEQIPNGYTYVGADKESITLRADGENTITLRYESTAPATPTGSYTVVHQYYTNGALTGSTSTTYDDVAVGTLIAAASIVRVPTFDGNTYVYTSVTGGDIIVAEGDNGTITLRYDRTVYTPAPTPTPTPTPPPTPGGTTITPTPTPTGPAPSDDGTDIEDNETPLAVVGLNTIDHIAYIIGYEDGTVRPDGNITRAEVATIFFRLMTDEFRTANWSTENLFPDVASTSWYNNAVSTCAQAGILNGYLDGSFKGNQNITRAEFAAIAARFLSDEYTGPSGRFSDVSGHWAEHEIDRAVAEGWIQGYTDGTFRPDQDITRAEAVTLINRMLDRMPDPDHLLEEMIEWPDNTEDKWYYEDIQEATNSHDYDRDEIGIMEIWTEKLAERDWKEFEYEWSTAASAPGGEVADNLYHTPGSDAEDDGTSETTDGE